MIFPYQSFFPQKNKVSPFSIDPFNPEQVQPASYDLTLGDTFLFYEEHKTVAYDPIEDDQLAILSKKKFVDGDVCVLHPQEFILGTTAEKVSLSRNVAGTLMGKSSLGRVGLIVHATAGFIDPGFQGKITLEITNISPVPLILTPGMLIAQIAFYRLTESTKQPYGSWELGSKYQNQDDVEASGGVN